jgi:hypothetical protein
VLPTSATNLKKPIWQKKQPGAEWLFCSGHNYIWFVSKIPQNKVGFTGIQTQFDSPDFGMSFIVRSHSITEYCSAVITVDDPQPVNRGIGPPELCINRCDCLYFGHGMNIDFLKSQTGFQTASPHIILGILRSHMRDHKRSLSHYNSGYKPEQTEYPDREYSIL